MSAGQPIEIKLYGRLASRLCRLLELIGDRSLSGPCEGSRGLSG